MKNPGEKLVILPFILLLLYACEDKDNDVHLKNSIYSSLTGTTWVDTVHTSSDAYYVYQLTFNDDESFTARTSSYSASDSLANAGLSGWFVYTGNYSISKDSLNFISTELTSWESSQGFNPITLHEQRIIFDNCTFELDKDGLILNYTTYPDNISQKTVRSYKQLDN